MINVHLIAQEFCAEHVKQTSTMFWEHQGACSDVQIFLSLL